MRDFVTISKWGNSQGIRLPKAFCEQLHLSVGDKVSVSLENDKIVISAPEDQYTLQERLKNWDGKRLETSEVDWGAPVGKEIW